MTYVAAVFSLKKRWLERHPDAARLRLRILSRKTFDRIEGGEEVSKVLRRYYKRWVHEEGIEECDTEVEAWEAAIEIQSRIRSQDRKIDLYFEEPNHRLYVVQMDSTVLQDSTFAKMNPDLPGDENRTCVYVGMTSSPLRERYDQHRSETHKANTKWGRKFFMTPFESALRSDLLDAYRSAGNEVEHLNQYEALKGECALRCWLQESLGIAAYSN